MPAAGVGEGEGGFLEGVGDVGVGGPSVAGPPEHLRPDGNRRAARRCRFEEHGGIKLDEANRHVRQRRRVVGERGACRCVAAGERHAR